MEKKLWLRCQRPLVTGSLCDFTDFPTILLSPPTVTKKLGRAQWIRKQLALRTLCGMKLETRQLGVLCVTLGERCKLFLPIQIEVSNWPRKISLARMNSPEHGKEGRCSPEHGKEGRQESSRGGLCKVCRQRGGNGAIFRARMDLSREQKVFGRSYWGLKEATWLTHHLRRQF